MTKSELIHQVAAFTEIPKTEVRAIMAALMNPRPGKGIIATALKGGEKVTLTGFGTFFLRQREARKARNPITGEAVKVPRRKYPSFKAAKKLKDALKK